jgi:hypothetical protein
MSFNLHFYTEKSRRNESSGRTRRVQGKVEKPRLAFCRVSDKTKVNKSRWLSGWRARRAADSMVAQIRDAWRGDAVTFRLSHLMDFFSLLAKPCTSAKAQNGMEIEVMLHRISHQFPRRTPSHLSLFSHISITWSEARWMSLNKEIKLN